MKKSSTLPGNLSQWSRKVFTGCATINARGGVNKKRTFCKAPPTAAEMLKNYEKEEDEFLRELDRLQRANNINNSGGSGSAGSSANNGSAAQQQRRPSRSASEASSIASSICTSAQSDLLGSFCHLMNYVVHLRRENRHLRKQVLCLQEMRKIEQLQNELIRAACTCCGDSVYAAASAATGTAATTTDDGTAKSYAEDLAASHHESKTPAANVQRRSGGGESNCNLDEKLLHSSPTAIDAARDVGRFESVPIVVGDEKKISLRRNDTPSFAESRTPEDPISPAISLDIAASLSPPSAASTTNRHLLMAADTRYTRRPFIRNDSSRAVVRDSAEEALAEHTDLNQLLMQTSAEYSNSSISSNIGTSKDILNKYYSDNEDQTSVFTEVQLPTLKTRDSVRSEPRRPPISTPDNNRHSSTEFGRTSAAAILERLGIRPLKSKRSKDDKKRVQSMFSESTVSPTDASAYRSPTTVSDVMQDGETWKIMRKAFVKKRKRKISESDSVASSDASSKHYSLMELTDLRDEYNTSSLSAAPIQNLAGTKMDYIQGMSKITKEYSDKMKKWEAMKNRRSTNKNISQKGDTVKRSWLRKPKQQRVDSSASSATENQVPDWYFEHDDGRQMTVIEQDDDANVSTPVVQDTANGNRLTVDDSARFRKYEYSPTELNRKDASDGRASLAVNREPRRKDSDQRRSVTFCDHSRADSTLSTTNSQMTVSNDSVFLSHDTDSNELYNGAGGDLVEHLLVLQEKNSTLIRTLRDKTDEYEKITDQLSSLEQEVKALRDRYQYDTALDNIYTTLIEPNYVHCSVVEELENQIQSLDNNIRTIKTESYQAQQIAQENFVKEQMSSRRYLDQIEMLQNINLQLIQKHLADLSPYDPELRRHFQIAQNYESLFKFTMNLLRKLKQYRCKLLEKNSTVCKLDMELLQTQSSLLLAHAQLERQKMEIRVLKRDQRPIRRTQSYHGQDLLLRFVNNQLSFFLPFKLQGSRVSNSDHHQSNFSLYDTEDTLEEEFARLFDYEKQRSSNNYDELEQPTKERQRKVVNRRSTSSVDQMTTTNFKDRPKSCFENPQQNKLRNCDPSKSVTISPTPSRILIARSDRPGSCIVPCSNNNVCSYGSPASYDRLRHNADVDRIVEEQSQRCSVQLPIYATKAPTPLKLGNVGQVRSIAAAFDLPSPNDNPCSAPNTPLAKAAPHLCHFKEQQTNERLDRVYDSPPSQTRRFQPQSAVVMRRDFSSNRNDRVMSSINQRNSTDQMVVSVNGRQMSRIPVRMSNVENQQLGYSHPQLSAKRVSPPNFDRTYETLTLRRNLKMVGRNVPSFMDKSTTPESTSISTGGSNWSIAKRNEARRRQFFYGEQKEEVDLPKTPTPPPTISPSMPKSPVPSSPSYAPNASTKLKSLPTLQKSTENAKQVQTNVVQQQEVVVKKRTSWFQKLRHKK